jgi:pentatricopeptide repeat protein
LNKALTNAIHLVESGRTEEGLNKLEQLENDLHDEEKFTLAEYYFKWGIVDKSLAIMEDLHALYPEESDIILFLAEIYMEYDQEEQAIHLLNQIDVHDEAYPQCLLLLADLYQLQGLPEVSEQKLQEAKKILPDEKVIDFALGELYFHSGKYKKAILAYQQVLNEYDELSNVNIYNRVAECLSASGRFEEALSYFEKGMQKQEDIHTIFSFGFTALQAEYYQTAIKQFEKVKSLDPEYTSVYLFLAKSYEYEGMLKESLETVNEGLKYDSFNKELYLYGGKVALKNKRPEEAEKMLKEALALDPGYIEAAITLTDFYLSIGKYEETIEILSEIMADDGEFDPKFHWTLARAYNEIERYSDALNHYQHAYTFFKDDFDFLQEYAHFLLEEGDRKHAKELFEKLLKLDPTNVEIYDILEQLDDNFSE